MYVHVHVTIAEGDTDSTVEASFHEPTLMHRLFRDVWAPFILRPWVKAVSWLLFILYLCLSFYGCANMRVDISPKKYIRDNSPIQTFVHLAGEHVKMLGKSGPVRSRNVPINNINIEAMTGLILENMMLLF